MNHEDAAKKIIREMKAAGYTDAEDAGGELTDAIEEACEDYDDFDKIESIIYAKF